MNCFDASGRRGKTITTWRLGLDEADHDPTRVPPNFAVIFRMTTRLFLRSGIT